MVKVEDLFDVQTRIDGEWVIARPLRGNLLRRIKDAWSVVIGKADAVMFYKQ